MLTILTTTSHQQQISEYISSVDRLDELVTVVTDIDDNSDLLVVRDESIQIPIDWYDMAPPYIFPSITLSSDNLLGVIFYKLGNHQRAFEYINQDNQFYNDLLIATNLQFNYEISEESYAYAQTTSLHNCCIIQHYGNYANRIEADRLEDLYLQAISEAKNDEYRVFSAKHYISFLMAMNEYDEAEKMIRVFQEDTVSEESKNALNVELASVLMAKVSVPYDMDLLSKIIEIQLQSIAFYEAKGLKVNAGLLLIDASEIANHQGEYIRSKELINKAILYFKEEDIPELLGEAGLRKATLLYTWSKNGSPQYYKPAINAFQDTLKIFKRDTHPQRFADVHHNLALIYSEIPVSAEEKPIWTAFCASSFKEVLGFYTKEQYPYEYAMVNHNYATALMNFPEAKLHNNLDKAFKMFEEALSVRTVKEYPFERALTLLNQLELYWLMHNENKEEEIKKYEEMLAKSNEIKTLVTETALHEKATAHIEELKKLKLKIV